MGNLTYSPFADINPSTVLRNKKICLDPGHGGTAGVDLFRQGPTGEREEWINLRVAMILKEMLEKAGAQVIMTRTEDEDISIRRRADIAIENKADVFISIHHNATVHDSEVNFPLIFFWKDAKNNPASLDLGIRVLRNFEKYLNLPPGQLYSDFLIFPGSGTGVLRYTYPYMPGIIGEACFFSNPESEKRLKDPEYNRKEAQAYFDAIVDWFANGVPKAELLEPSPGKPINPVKPIIKVKLSDGLGGYKIEKASIKVFFNDREVEYNYSEKDGILLVKPSLFHSGDQTLRIFARNLNGNSMHPASFSFRLGGYPQKTSTKAWLLNYEKGKKLLEEVKGEKIKNKDEEEKIYKAIDYLKTSLSLFPNSEVSDKCQYLLGVAYEKLPDTFANRKSAIEAYQQLIDYYPTSSYIKNAEQALERLLK